MSLGDYYDAEVSMIFRQLYSFKAKRDLDTRNGEFWM